MNRLTNKSIFFVLKIICLITSIIAFQGCKKNEDPKKTVLVASPIRQKPAILNEFLASLDRLDNQNLKMSYLFVDDNEIEESKNILNAFAAKHSECCTVINAQELTTNDQTFCCDEQTHHWKEGLVWKVAAFKDMMIEHAKNKPYDYLFLVDSDLVLYPQTVEHLANTGKPIVSEVFWTSWSPGALPRPQVWLLDNYTQYHMEIGEDLSHEEKSKRENAFIDQLRVPGTYEVGGLGACTLLSKEALNAGVNFKRISNILMHGEDRHFCIRAKALGLDLFVDTHYPAYHIYRESALAGVNEFVQKTLSGQRADSVAEESLAFTILTKMDLKIAIDPKPHRLTLSMIMKNEENRYLRKVLESAREYITDAVIIDDASTDNSVAVAEEVLKGIPLKIVKNEQSKFSNEVELRKQQWDETVKTNPEWILVLDADEVFEDRFKDQVQTLLSNNDVSAIYFRLYDMWDDSHYRDDQFWKAHKSYNPFLIRYQPDIEYRWNEVALHGGRMPASIGELPKVNSDLRLKHFGWARSDDRKAKYDRYKQLDPDAKFGWKEQYESILDPSPNLALWDDGLTNRFIVKSDPSVNQVAGVHLRDTWWSRPYEYAWAMNFVGSNLVVLDAACGVSHPFKWYLGETCKVAWACDTDLRLVSEDQLMKETEDDLGIDAVNTVKSKDRLSNVVLALASICELPAKMPLYDRIFCISTLEHLDAASRKRVLSEFAQHLAPDGLIVLTVDYPDVTPEVLIADAASVSLVPVGDIQLGQPPEDAIHAPNLWVYRCVLKHKKN